MRCPTLTSAEHDDDHGFQREHVQSSDADHDDDGSSEADHNDEGGRAPQPTSVSSSTPCPRGPRTAPTPIVLRASYAMSGTDILCCGSLATRSPLRLAQCCPIRAAQFWRFNAFCLRACYATSGTDLAYAAICILRACYAMPGTDAATCSICQVPSDAMSGTDIA
eukprot:2511693-Rhodomonas_salina.5